MEKDIAFIEQHALAMIKAKQEMGGCLFALRKRIGLTREKVSDETGVSQRSIIKVELGKTGVSYLLILKLMHYYYTHEMMTEEDNVTCKQGEIHDVNQN